MRMRELLADWSIETYSIYNAHRDEWRDMGLKVPEGEKWMFSAPASRQDILDCEERLSVSMPMDMVEFYRSSNGWPLTYGRKDAGYFLPVQEIAPLKQMSAITYKTFRETLEMIGWESPAGGYICLTSNPMGSEMVLGSCDFGHFIIDPFLGDLEPRRTFYDVLRECRSIYNEGLRDAFTNPRKSA